MPPHHHSCHNHHNHDVGCASRYQHIEKWALQNRERWYVTQRLCDMDQRRHITTATTATTTTMSDVPHATNISKSGFYETKRDGM